MNNSHGPTYKYGISTKLDLYTHQDVMEYANCFTGASLSEAVRELIAMGLKAASTKPGGSPTFKLAQMRRERAWSEEYRRWLSENYIILQQDYSAEFEQVLKDFAKEKNLQYPPDVTQFSLWDVDKDLSKTLNAVKTCCNGSSETSLREVMRVTNYSREEVLSHLDRLRDFGQVQFDDPLPNAHCTIKLQNI